MRVPAGTVKSATAADQVGVDDVVRRRPLLALFRLARHGLGPGQRYTGLDVQRQGVEVGVGRKHQTLQDSAVERLLRWARSLGDSSADEGSAFGEMGS